MLPGTSSLCPICHGFGRSPVYPDRPCRVCVGTGVVPPEKASRIGGEIDGVPPRPPEAREGKT